MTTPKDIRWWWGVELCGKSWTPAAHSNDGTVYHILLTTGGASMRVSGRLNSIMKLSFSKVIRQKGQQNNGNRDGVVRILTHLHKRCEVWSHYAEQFSSYKEHILQAEALFIKQRAKSCGANQCSTNMPFKVPMRSGWFSCWISYIYNQW